MKVIYVPKFNISLKQLLLVEDVYLNNRSTTRPFPMFTCGLFISTYMVTSLSLLLRSLWIGRVYSRDGYGDQIVTRLRSIMRVFLFFPRYIYLHNNDSVAPAQPFSPICPFDLLVILMSKTKLTVEGHQPTCVHTTGQNMQIMMGQVYRYFRQRCRAMPAV